MWSLEHFTQVRRWYALHLLLGVTFFVSSLLINMVQLLLFVTLRPLNKSLYRRINYYLMYSLMSQILFLAEWWSESDIEVCCTDEDYTKLGNESAFLVMNHTCEVDWLLGWIVADRCRILGGAKVFVKDMMKYVPTIGWAWGCSDIIFLKRNWKEDQVTLPSQISELFDYPYPVWTVMFCEGTRFTTEKHEASMKFARANGIPELKHLLIPRTRGFTECMRTMKGHFECMYDVTISFNTKNGAAPTLLSMLRGQKVMGEMHVRRISLDEVPSEEEKAAEYLHQLYREKDLILDSYHKTGFFWSPEKTSSLRVKCFPRRYYSLVNTVCWTIVVVVILGFQYYSLLTTGSILANTIAVSIFALAYFGLYKMIGLTKLSKASKYGDKTT